jgi:ribonuclease HI
MPGKIAFYAVRKGRIPGIYLTWNEAKKQINGYSGAIFKKFNTKQQALKFANISHHKYNSQLKTSSPKETSALPEILAPKETYGKKITSVMCFTDGSCLGNPGPCGAGVFIQFPDGKEIRRAFDLGHGTNNIGELTAIGMVLAIFINDKEPKTLEIISDSTYSIGMINYDWKVKANKELINSIKTNLAIVRKTHVVSFIKVEAHCGIYGNEIADQLAVQGASGLVS